MAADHIASEPVAEARPLMQRLFALWFDAFVYNQIWEDPRVDIEALRIDGNSSILTISSGGCNALNYLLEDPASVTAVDLNRNHTFLLRLKLAALRTLPEHEPFFDLFGRGSSSHSDSLYLRYIRDELDPATRDFWESNSLIGSLFYGDRISFFRGRGLYDHSRNGYFLRFFHWLSRRFGFNVNSILSASTLEEQRLIHSREIDPFFEHWLIKYVSSLPLTAFGLGIPPQQFDELKNDASEGSSVIDIYRERVRKLACDFAIRDNYFAWQAFSRRYDTDNRVAVPEYLKEENYAKLRANSGRLATKIGSVTDEILSNPHGTFNRFVFLDAQDWMYARELAELWTGIAERADPGARVIFRTAGENSPLESKLPKDIRSRFQYDETFSSELFTRDRSSIYGGFHLYILK
jgi:S-adenosylmethionine-diacylglycerol 3-amino-3-carboxypropyl transferase